MLTPRAKETFLPVGVVSSLVEQMVEERNYDHQGQGGQTVLSYETGIDARRLKGIIKKEHRTVSYTVVDKILTGTGNHMKWYEEPFNHYHDETNTIKSIWEPPSTSGIPLPCCRDCGKQLDRRNRHRCIECFKKFKKETSASSECECGAPKDSKSETCRACWDARRRPLSAGVLEGRRKQAKSMKRLFVP